MRRLCLGFVVFVVAIVAACGSSSTSPVTPPLATLPEGLQSAGEAADTEVLSLLACAGDAVVVAASLSPNGTEIAGFRRGHEVSRKDSTLATSAGALWIGSGRIVVALVDFAGHEVVILDRVGGSWRETRASSPVIGGDPLWPAFLTGSDGAPELLCFVQAPGDHQGEAGLYLTPVDGSGERWALVRKGSFAWSGPPWCCTRRFLLYCTL